MTNQTPRNGPTSRDTIKYGAAVAGGGLLAGCTGQSGSTETETTEDDESTSYEACIEPVGCLNFEDVPETYVVNNGGWTTKDW